MAQHNKSSKLADKLFPEIQEPELDILDIAPEKRRLNTEIYDFSVSTIIDYISKKHIIVPEFQRAYVWNRSQASRLIESLIINCPIPVIFLSQNTNETLSVIDGNQRVTAISLYLSEESFELKGLTAYPELEGFKFGDLDPRIKRHIQNRTIRCIVILKDTHPQIKFDVFERLNTGSVKLNPQELRHGIYSGTLIEKVSNLSKNLKFREMTMTKDDKRMKGDELVLRFFALSSEWRNYTKPLVSFINNFTETNRNPSESFLQETANDFLNVIEKISTVLGKYAFKTYEENLKSAKFNAALYDAQMVAFYEENLSEDDLIRLQQTDFVLKNQKLLQQSDFGKLISASTTDKAAVAGRIEMYKKFLRGLV